MSVHATSAPQPQPQSQPQSQSHRLQRVKSHRRKCVDLKLVILFALVVVLILIAIFAEQLCPYDPYAQNLSAALQAPSSEHLLGTDRFGRDMLSRVIVGAQSSISSTLALVAIVCALGTLVGVIAGWRGGWVDTLLMRTSDIFLAFPGLVFALAVSSVLGGGISNAVIALAAISWPKYARIARSQTLRQREQTYLQAERMAGCTTAQLLVRHVLPNIAGPIVVTAVLDVGTMMMELAGLSYLGLGAQPPMAEWGSMMSDGRSMMQLAPWVVIGPGLGIFVTVVIFNLFGDALRDHLDPAAKSKARGKAHGKTRGKTRGKTSKTGDKRTADKQQASSSLELGI